MIKMVYCLRRLPGISEEEFHRYWLEQHGPLVRSVAEDMGIVRYVQTHTAQTPMNEILQRSRGLGEAYDGVAELWWESEEQMVDALSSPQGLEAQTKLTDDEATFIDFASSCAWLAEEHVIFDLRE
jgi:uncharacterized protein (TIGR02118 family)